MFSPVSGSGEVTEKPVEPGCPVIPHGNGDRRGLSSKRKWTHSAKPALAYKAEKKNNHPVQEEKYLISYLVRNTEIIWKPVLYKELCYIWT